MQTINSGELLTPAQASAQIGLAEPTLANLRSTGKGPPFYKIGAKYIRYDSSELDAWMRSKRRTSTSQAEAA